MGAIFASIGYGVIFYRIRRIHRIEELKRSGNRFSARIIEIEKDYSWKVNGQSPYRVGVKLVEGNTNKIFFLAILFGMREIENLTIGDDVFVYLDSRDEKYYWIDLGNHEI